MEVSLIIKKNIISFILNEINDKVQLAFDEESGDILIDYFDNIKKERIRRIREYFRLYITTGDNLKIYIYNKLTELSYKCEYYINFTYVNSFNMNNCFDMFIEEVYKLISYMRDDLNGKDYRNLIFEVFCI